MYLVEFYYKLVKADRLTIDEVPIKFRERVQERLGELELQKLADDNQQKKGEMIWR